MEHTERYTRSPTPPLPARNPNHRYQYWKHPPPTPLNASNLAPRPLFSNRTRPPPTTLHVEVHNIRDSSPRPTSSQASAPSSPTASFRSLGSYAFSASIVSGPRSSSERSTSQGYAFPPADVSSWGNEWEPLPQAPRRNLKRKKSPRHETLRDLRVKESDVCLQKVYEQQLDAYLNGSLFARTQWKDELGCLEEE